MKHLIFPILTFLFISCTNKQSNDDNSYSVEEYEVTVDCPDCDGDGYNIYRCSSCDGEGTVTRTGTSYHDEPATCTSCFGTGEVYCNRCGGRGYTTCHACSGSGENTCSVCKGSGIYYLGEYYTCPTCDGLGRVTCYLCDGERVIGCCNDGKVICEECWGTGKSGRRSYSSSYVREVTCSSCDGEGRYRDECSTCNGTGEITETRIR